MASPIQYSEKTIRWIFEGTNPRNSENLSKISEWINNLNNQTVKIRCITKTEAPINTGIWIPTQEYPIVINTFENPQIENNILIFHEKEKTGYIGLIEYIDFDPKQNQLVVNINNDSSLERINQIPDLIYSVKHSAFVLKYVINA